MEINMKKVTLFVAVLLMLGFSSVGLAEMKIGVLDVNKVLADSNQVKNMQLDLKKRFDSRGQEVISLQDIFIKDLDVYKQTNTTLQGEKLKKEQQKLFDENKKLQEVRANFQRDLVAARDEALRPILKQIESIANKIAKDQKFDLIITKVSTVYVNTQFEITDVVIAEMAKLVPSKVAVKPVVKK